MRMFQKENVCVSERVCVCTCMLHPLYGFKISKTLPSSPVIIYDKAGGGDMLKQDGKSANVNDITFQASKG